MVKKIHEFAAVGIASISCSSCFIITTSRRSFQSVTLLSARAACRLIRMEVALNDLNLDQTLLLHLIMLMLMVWIRLQRRVRVSAMLMKIQTKSYCVATLDLLLLHVLLMTFYQWCIRHCYCFFCCNYQFNLDADAESAFFLFMMHYDSNGFEAF